jgi:hypothetical protein
VYHGATEPEPEAALQWYPQPRDAKLKTFGATELCVVIRSDVTDHLSSQLEVLPVIREVESKIEEAGFQLAKPPA